MLYNVAPVTLLQLIVAYPSPAVAVTPVGAYGMSVVCDVQSGS
jgi:hypothetical protein